MPLCEQSPLPPPNKDMFYISLIYFFLLLSNNPLYQKLLIHSLLDRRLLLLPFGNYRSFCWHVFLFHLSKCPEIRLPGHIVNICLKFVRNDQTGFLSSCCNILHSHQQRMSPTAPYPHKLQLLCLFLVGVKGQLIVA